MGRVTLIRHAYGVPPSPRGRQEIGCVSCYLITENILIYKNFQITKNIKPLPSPRGKVPTSSCGGRRMRVTPQPLLPSDSRPLNPNFISTPYYTPVPPFLSSPRSHFRLSSKNKYTFLLYLFIFYVDFFPVMQYNNTDILCAPLRSLKFTYPP